MKEDSVRRTLALLLSFVLIMIAAPIFVPYKPDGGTTVSRTKYQSPSFSHPMGTDASDRDVLSRVLRGTQRSVILGAGATFVTLAVGASFGVLAGMAGGRIDTLLMRFVDTCLSVPRFLILLAVTSISAVGVTYSLFQLILLIGLTGWFDVARLVRGETSGLVQRDWFMASRASGARSWRLAQRQIFPHLVPMLIVMATLGIGRAVVLEAGLSFLGANTSSASLGHLINDGMSAYLTRWWLAVFPGLALVLIVLACNALGNALRDVFAPEQVHAWPTT